MYLEKTFNFLTMYIFFQSKTINQTLKLVLNPLTLIFCSPLPQDPGFPVRAEPNQDGRFIMDPPIGPEVQDFRPDQGEKIKKSEIFEIEKY